MGPRNLVLGVLTCLAIILSSDRAHACSCVGGTPICQSFWTTDAVFSGDVLEVSPIPNPDGEGFQPHRRVRFRVLEGWRGRAGATVELTTGAGGGDCGYTFEKGVSYLVFASARAGALTTGICSRTRKLTDAAEDLAYLRTALRPAATGRIFGSAMYQRDPNSPPGPRRPTSGYPVELSDGNRTWKTSTDPKGTYEFTGIPAGAYVVTLLVPATEHAGSPHQVTLADPRGCAAADFHVVPDGRIGVRVLNTSGQPVAGLSIDLVDVDAVKPGEAYYGHTYEKTDATGRIEWAQLHPNRFAVAINATRPPGAAQPYPTTFFPGVRTLAEAATVSLGLGERLDLGDWTLPTVLAERTITGRVSWPDGQPAVGARVNLVAPRTGLSAGRQVDGAYATTDKDGRFTLPAYEGVTYDVRAFPNGPGAVGPRVTLPWRAIVQVTPGASGEILQMVLRSFER